MFIQVSCQKCGEVQDLLTNDKPLIGEDVEAPEFPCPKCLGVKFTRVVQSTIARHGSWGRW